MPPFFCLPCLPAIRRDSIWPRDLAIRTRRLTSIFFRTVPAFTGELLLIYFFVIWLDRHARRRAARCAVRDGTGQQGQTNQCAESTAF
ncbi:hypothetical protein DF147_17840 [Burkholderia cenocepacia]|nr:hypothetical protein DF147_17840 [Burkholderia cenocepacia]RQV14439.1 hypothetical protein DF132_30570 [Burkholderia cenocepacia]RQV64703.1 hypothetical protein DF024_13130 [Burkholderia cenocepacia]RQV87917.1 hypothetical protein DF019_20750 [Burkholderia cenocepacia]